MKTNSKLSAYILRGSTAALLFSCVIVAICSAINLPEQPLKTAPPQDNAAFGANGHASAASVPASATRKNRTLSFADRVAYQRAIEDVYWRHRIWPPANAGPKPSLDKVMSQAQIEKKVEDYLRNSQALEDYWQRPITPDQLQAEMERTASHTKQPGVLCEIFAALGNDSFVIAECLARAVLAERLITELYAHDQRFQGELKRRAEAELRAQRSVRQMKRTSATYTEMDWIKTDSAPADARGVVATPLRGVGPNVPQARGYSERHDAPNAIRMNGSEWQESVEKLAREFGFGVRRHVAAFESADMSAHSKKAAAGEYENLPVGKVSPLQEDQGHYYAVAVMKKGKDRLKVATIAWLKEPLRSWLARAETQVPVTMAAVSANYTLPVISSPSGGCIDDTWTPTSLTNAPEGRIFHTAVWTGSEMIVWGGDAGALRNTGGRYDPGTDSWTATSTTGAPSARALHTAVWTGSEMIVWGGFGASLLNTGGRYNPITDSWTATSTSTAPAPRYSHIAVWTDSEMIVWGGQAPGPSLLNTGGRYDPITDSWTATSTTGAPTARSNRTAVWTGSEMIVWGGVGSDFFNTGGRYNPSTDSWTATNTANAPAGREVHTAVWTGSEMIVWGGVNCDPVCFTHLNTGGRYCAATPAPTPTATPTATPSACSWSAGPDMPSPDTRSVGVFFPVNGKFYAMGGRDRNNVEFTHPFEYDPVGNSWTTKSATYPDTQVSNMACSVLNDSGTDYIYCAGGFENDSQTTTGRVFRYDPITDVITTVTGGDWPPGTNTYPGGFSVFNNKLYILGGFDVPDNILTDQIWEFTATTNVWVQKNAVLPVPLSYIPTATIGSLIYTGGGGVITGGTLTDTTNSFVYDPVADSISTIAPIPRATSNTRGLNFNGQMYVLGGAFNAISNEVDIYDPLTDTWSLGPPFTTARRNAATDTDGTTNIWLAGGYDSSVVPTASIEIFNCPQATPTPTPTVTVTPTATPRQTPTPRPRPTPFPRPTP